MFFCLWLLVGCVVTLSLVARLEARIVDYHHEMRTHYSLGAVLLLHFLATLSCVLMWPVALLAVMRNGH